MSQRSVSYYLSVNFSAGGTWIVYNESVPSRHMAGCMNDSLCRCCQETGTHGYMRHPGPQYVWKMWILLLMLLGFFCTCCKWWKPIHKKNTNMISSRQFYKSLYWRYIFNFVLSSTLSLYTICHLLTVSTDASNDQQENVGLSCLLFNVECFVVVSVPHCEIEFSFQL